MPSAGCSMPPGRIGTRTPEVQGRNPVSGIYERLWTWALTMFGLTVLAHITWALLKPLLPVIAVMSMVGFAAAATISYYRNRW